MLLAAILLSLVASCSATATKQPCVIPVYLVKDACGKAGVSHKCMVWENRWILNALLSDLPSRCGCHVRLLDRQGVVDAIAALPSSSAPVTVLVAMFGLKALEDAAIRAMQQHTKQKLVVIHLNDEKWTRPHNISWYPLVKAVFRNYHHDYQSLTQHLRYIRATLASDPALPPIVQSVAPTPRQAALLQAAGSLTPAGSSVYWVPLGFGENFFTAEVMQQEFQSRPLLWSWVGSVGGKLERQEMVRHFEASDVKGVGFLRILQNFMSTDMLSPMRYTDLLHQSKLIPLPRGVHWEQYRLWEAFAAGAIPMALSEHRLAGLAHVELLGFKAVWVETWQQAPAVLAQVLSNSTLQAELGQWQRHNWARYRQVLQVVAGQVAQSVCEAVPDQ